MSALDDTVQRYVTGLAIERDKWLALRSELGKDHPGWADGRDARLNLVAKPANLIFSAIVDLRVTQHAVAHPAFWAKAIAPELNSEALIAAPLFELQTFYRFGFFQFMMSSIEHGLRAIQPIVVHGTEGQADQPHWKIYTSLFKAALPHEKAEQHTRLFGFLSALRNTIHNNGVYYPVSHSDATYTIGERTYTLKDGERVDYFGWEYFIEWLPYIHAALADLLRAPVVVSPNEIADIAMFAIPGVELHQPRA